ncbi:hypothetical protein G4B88_022186 [Cannabis sativa]|uniref:Reverse transcriptase zinc-binding domain-containing protein n=1 Tax=Cannabis sativa TaxID=3483 RepID=A0A7J6G0K4_CANSA|nr:hypothetical protein G4B88_022186 [Cannabis sativa]
MKNFLWRVFHHWLPTKSELTKRGMTLNTYCDLCQQHEEDVCHALWLCPKSLKLWKVLGFSKYFPPLSYHAADFLWWLKDLIPTNDLIWFIGYSWLVWQRRNTFMFQHKSLNDNIWLPWAHDLLEEHLGSHQKLHQISAPKPNMSWNPPHPNSFMINTDASLIIGQAGYSISAVIRDSEGSLLVAETEFVNGYSSILLAEASAILLGLRLALSRSILQAQVASDNATIIHNIQLKSSNKSEGVFSS